MGYLTKFGGSNSKRLSMHSEYISQVPEWQIVSDFKAARKDEGGSDANRHLIRAKLQRVSK